MACIFKLVIDVLPCCKKFKDSSNNKRNTLILNPLIRVCVSRTLTDRFSSPLPEPIRLQYSQDTAQSHFEKKFMVLSKRKFVVLLFGKRENCFTDPFSLF